MQRAAPASCGTAAGLTGSERSTSLCHARTPQPRRTGTAEEPLPSSANPLRLIAHRGAVDRDRVENTLPAIDGALADGAYGVEVDARLTGDGVPVCCHDSSLLRVAGTDVAVARSSAADLRRIRVAGAVATPALRDVVETVADRGRLIVEVKRGEEPPGETALAVGRLLAADRLRDVVVSSFDADSLRRLRAAYPALRTALLVPERAASVRILDRAGRLGCAEVHVERRAARPHLVRAARRRGLGVLSWTFDLPGQLERLPAGIDGAIVDSPLHTLGATG